MSSAVIRTDRRLLRRVLQNLLSNAIKYTDRGGVLLGCRHASDKVRIEVHDTGSGIPANQQKRIFQEFHRLEDGAVRARGLGLGLSIVERIVGILNLDLGLRSQVGRGSVFALTAERIHEAPAVPLATGRSHGQVGQLAGLLVLVIDNEARILDGMRTLLESWGCTVLTAEGQTSAMQAVQAASRLPDVVLADYHLDSGTGIELVRRLRAEVDPALPAALVTADRSRQLKRLADANGLELLNKPVKPAALRALVAQFGARRLAAE